jgi:diacylglycerol kinase family enzyme
VTIRKGEEWGEAGPLASDGVLVETDAAADDVVAAARRARRPVPELGFVGGDLARTLGAKGDVVRLRSEEARRVPLDLGTVLVDGRVDFFVAHLVVRRRFWQGPFVVVMNAEYLGDMKLAPRAHPGDGMLDVLEGSLGLDDRLRARRRARTGDHVPHPGITQRRASALHLDVPRGSAVWLDGRRLPTARSLSVRLEPDALLGVV